MEVNISEHFTYKKLIRYVLPCVAMMVMTSVYSIVDGFFVSNYAGKNAFAAVNLIMPVLMAIASFGFMIGTGGSALVAFYLGLKDKKKANEVFSMLIFLILIGAAVIAAAGFLFMPQIVDLLGASEHIRENAVLYGRILILAEPFYMLQNSFQSFLTTAGKQHYGLYISVTAGIVNMGLDFLLVAVFPFGIAGAAAATFASQCVGGLIPFVYFVRKNKSALRISPTRFDWKSIGKACSNGSSEMLSNLSISLVSVLYNFQLMRAAAENGIAAYGVVMYGSYLAVAVYMGYAIGINPIVGYHYGAKNRKELHNILKNSLVITGCAALVITAVTEILALPIAKIFVGYDEVLCQMTRKGFMLYSVSYLFSGFNIFGSAFFTGLNNGKVSAAISFLRTLVIQIIAVVLLPIWFGIDGIWCAVTVAEVITLLVTVTFLIRGRKQYGY
mgnify:CR=1 FL=1